MEPTAAVEAVKTAAEIDFKTGGAMAALGAVAMKLIDKIPWGSLIGRPKKQSLTKTDIELAIMEHSEDCRKCLDQRFASTIAEFKEWRKEDSEWRKEDIKERREFRHEMLDGLNRVHTRLDGKADK